MSRQIVSSREQFDDYKQKLVPPRDSNEPAAPGSKPRRRRLRSSRELIVRFLQLLEGERGLVAFALVTLTIATPLGLIPPASTKLVIDNVIGNQPLSAEWAKWITLPTDRWQALVAVTLFVLVISLAKILIQLWGRWAATKATKRAQLSIRKLAFEHAVRLPLHRVQELKSGGVASLLREDASSVGELIFGLLYNPWRAVIQLIGSLVVLAWVDWKLLLGALLLLPLIYATHRTWIHRLRPQYRGIRSRREQLDAQATETFGGMRVVRAFNRQRSEGLRFMRGHNLMGRQELYAWWWARLIELVWAALIPVSSALLMLYGGRQVIQGTLTMGDLMMFLVYLLMLLEPLAVLAESATSFQNSLSGLDRVLDLLDESREMPNADDALRFEKSAVAGAIRFDNVRFVYPGSEQPALEAVTLDVQAGQTIALVGPSGAGKTTLCNLVARFYDPTSGRVLLDGRDLRDIDVESYRGLLGFVEQDVFLFDGSVADNIGYADRGASMERIVQAAETANALDFINALPQGFDTVIGERGVRLSGGQRQRIAIARAVLADPRILILDEATSNLDTESERLIQSAMSRLMRNRTCFVIAHRLSTITHADRIVVVESGRIVESGTHAELMETGGSYRDMVRLQVSSQADMAEAADVAP